MYNSHYIREFIKIYTDAFFGEDTLEGTIAQIKLNDLIQNPETTKLSSASEQYNQLFTIDAPRYMVDENGYNRLRDKEYLANIERRAKVEIIERKRQVLSCPDERSEHYKQDIEILNMTNNTLNSEIKDVQSKILPINKDMTEAFPKFAEITIA